MQIVAAQNEVTDAEFTNVVTDSRKAGHGDLFIALKGEKFDGHEFVKEVIAKVLDE